MDYIDLILCSKYINSRQCTTNYKTTSGKCSHWVGTITIVNTYICYGQVSAIVFPGITDTRQGYNRVNKVEHNYHSEVHRP
jgi:hypothetical protein